MEKGFRDKIGRNIHKTVEENPGRPRRPIMKILANMHPVSVMVILIILALFALSVVMLFAVCTAYRRQAKLAVTGDTYRSRVMHDALEDFTTAYKTFGPETNTPAIINSAITNNLHFYLLCERFLNNSVSLFVTMGLLGTFLGLSLSVSSLSQLLGSTADWQNALNNMGSGLLSALSGMGVAFYTSLFGVGCSIILTILRTIFNPESIRQELENEMELWLDHRTAPRLNTDRVKDDSELVKRMIGGMNNAAGTMDATLRESTEALLRSMDGFSATVDSFNKGVRDFSEFDYNLRGTVERMDVAVRELASAIRRVTHGSERGDK